MPKRKNKRQQNAGAGQVAPQLAANEAVPPAEDSVPPAEEAMPPVEETALEGVVEPPSTERVPAEDSTRASASSSHQSGDQGQGSSGNDRNAASSSGAGRGSSTAARDAGRPNQDTRNGSGAGQGSPPAALNAGAADQGVVTDSTSQAESSGTHPDPGGAPEPGGPAGTRKRPRRGTCCGKFPLFVLSVLVAFVAYSVAHNWDTVFASYIPPDFRPSWAKTDFPVVDDEFGWITRIASKRLVNQSWYPDVESIDYTYTELIVPIDFRDDYRYVYVVHSTAQNREFRDAIRKTWGEDIRNTKDSAIVFFLGYQNQLRGAVAKEAAEFNDIVQFGVAEDNKHQSQKSIAMLLWANKTMSKDSFLVKANDDVLVNHLNFRNAIDMLVGIKPKFIAGNLVVAKRPHRTEASSWYVSRADFLESYYPPHMSGSLYVMTSNLAGEMLNMAKKTKYLPMEDVFITGMLAAKLNVPRYGLTGFVSQRYVSACDMHHKMVNHYRRPHLMLEDHRILKTTLRKCNTFLSWHWCSCYPAVDRFYLV